MYSKKSSIHYENENGTLIHWQVLPKGKRQELNENHLTKNK